MNSPGMKGHARYLSNLAWPLVLTQVGYVITGLVDNAFLGTIGNTEQAAGVLSNSVYIVVLVFTIGMSFATTPLTTEASEEGSLTKMASVFKHSLVLNLATAILSFIVLFFSSPLLYKMGQSVTVVDMAVPFFNVLVLSMIPISFFYACKQYCEGLGLTRMALIISAIGNIINIILNYGLIWGKWGLPALGYMGSAWASFIARAFMGISFLWYVFRSQRTNAIKQVYSQVKLNWEDTKRMLGLGLNSALQMTFEVAAFVVAGLMCGVFGEKPLDAHGISLHLAAFTFMFASGIASATTIRVGVYKTQSDWREVRSVTRTALRMVIMVMSFFGLIFFSLNHVLPLIFTMSQEVADMAANLLLVAALFQVFDGLQVVLLGVLRGLQDVRMSTLITLAGYWGIAVPLAWFLAFKAHLEIIGVWAALLVSLVFVAGCLYLRIMHLFRKAQVTG